MHATTTAAPAVRARALATALRRLAATHPAAPTVLAIVALVDEAADGFDTAEPFIFEGVAVTNCTPAEAALPLMLAGAEAQDDPRTAHLTALLRYVTTGHLPELATTSPRQAREESAVRAGAILAACRAIHAADDAERTADTDELAGLLHAFARLMAEIADH